MIDASAYMERLEWLKEWMALKIDGLLPTIEPGDNFPLNINLFPESQLTPKEIMNVFYQTGVLLWKQKTGREINFHEYCTYKQSLSKTNQQ